MASAPNSDNGAATGVSTADESRRGEALVPLDYQNGAMSEMGWPAGFSFKPEILSAAPTLATMWAAFRRRWPLGLGVGIAVSVIGMLLIYLFVPIQYTAIARLRVYPSEREGNIDPREWEAYRETQKVLIRSSFVIIAALRMDDVGQMPMIVEQGDEKIGWLQDNLRANFTSPSSEILDIKFAYEVPKQAKDFVDAVQKAYLTEIVEKERSRILEAQDNLERTLAEKKEDLRDIRVELDVLTRDVGDRNSPQRQAEMLKFNQDIKRLGDRKSLVTDQIFHLELRWASIEKFSEQGIWPPPVPPGDLELYINADPEYTGLKGQLIQMKFNRQKEAFKVKDPTSRAIRQLDGQIDSLRSHIEDVRANLEITAQEKLNKHGSAADAIDEIRELIESWDVEVQKIDAKIAVATQKLTGLEKQTVEINQAKLELEQIEKLVSEFVHDLEMLKLSLTDSGRVVLLEPAHIPDQAGGWVIKAVLVLCVGMLGFVLGTGGVSYVEFQARRVDSSDDVSSGLGQTVVGTLPLLNGGLMRRGGEKFDEQLQAMLSDSIDSIRTTLVNNTSSDSVNVVMVTSPLDREGKTTLASQLAASLARAGRRVVLVDADVRNPSCHDLFKMNFEPGLSEVLREEAEVDDVVSATQVANLWLLPAGRFDGESIQALAKPVTADLFEQLRDRFEFVIVDAAAVLTVADALLIGQHVDGAVLSVLKDVSRVPDIYQAAERLKSVGVNLMGTVVNGVNNRGQKRMYRRQLVSVG